MTSEDPEEELAIELRGLNLYSPPTPYSPPGDYSKRSIHEISDLSECEDTVDGEEGKYPVAQEEGKGKHPVDREEGEISDDGELPSTKKATTGNQKRASRRKLHRAHERMKEQENMEKAQLEMKKILALVYQCDLTHIHIHNLRWKPQALEKLQNRELDKKSPLSRADVDELLPDTVWIHEPGIHLGLLSEERDTITIVLVVKIQSWDDMGPRTRIEVQSTLQHIMDWGEHVNEIRNNAAAKSPAATHGTSIIPLDKPEGVMFGVGWHQSQEEGKTLVNYAPKNKDAKTLAIYEELNSKLPQVAALYRDGLSRLFPGGATQLQNDADKEGVLSFGDALDGVSSQRPFANSLTATRQGFCNFQHNDNDGSPAAYGDWFEAENVAGDKKAKGAAGEHTWRFTPNADHDKTRGGEFLWGAFGIGVDFAKARGLVEIFWRGKIDHHGTLQSFDEPGFTRFGTSIQITKKGVNAMRKVWNVEELAQAGHDVHKLERASRITTAEDRIEKAKANQAKKKRKKARV